MVLPEVRTLWEAGQGEAARGGAGGWAWYDHSAQWHPASNRHDAGMPEYAAQQDHDENEAQLRARAVDNFLGSAYIFEFEEPEWAQHCNRALQSTKTLIW